MEILTNFWDWYCSVIFVTGFAALFNILGISSVIVDLVLAAVLAFMLPILFAHAAAKMIPAFVMRVDDVSCGRRSGFFGRKKD